MSHIDRYKNRLKRNGENVGEVYSNNTVAFIENTFSSSPTFRVLEVNSREFPDIKEIDARIINVERMGTLREVLFRPKQGLNVGTYVSFDNETWLIIDQWGERNSSSNYKALVEKCNDNLIWRDSNGVIQDIICVASQSPVGSKASQGKYDIEWNKYDVSLPIGMLYVFIEKNSLIDGINYNHRFIFGRSAYEVIGIDDTSFVNRGGYGLVQLTLKVTTKQDKDDFENGIAFNEYKKEDTTTGEEGMIW